MQEICEQYDVPALVLEACGWLGFEHASQHEKTSGADLSACARDLLSICLCPACAASLALDVGELAADIRAVVDRELQEGTHAGAGLADAIGAERALEIYRHRRSVIGGLVREAGGLADGRDVLLMATDDPQVTGPDVGVELNGVEVAAFVLKCWDDEEAAISRMKAAGTRTGVPLVANVNALGERPSELPGLVARLVAAGASEVRYYHAGLASPARLAAIRAAVQEVS